MKYDGLAYIKKKTTTKTSIVKLKRRTREAKLIYSSSALLNAGLFDAVRSLLTFFVEYT